MINIDKPNAVKARPRVMPISYAMVRKLVTTEIAVSQGQETAPCGSATWRAANYLPPADVSLNWVLRANCGARG